MKVILLLTMCLGLFACGNKNTKGSKAQEQQPQKDRVEVLYFHGKQRCITCAAIETNPSTSLKLKTKRSPTNTRSRGLHSSSQNGKMARTPRKT